MKRHAALAMGNDRRDKSTSHEVSKESFLMTSPRATASANTLSTLSLLAFPGALSSVAMTSVKVTISGDTFSLLGWHISNHRSCTSTGFSAAIPAPINALYATISGWMASLFMLLNKSKAGSHFLELAHAEIADVYATLLGFMRSPFMALIRSTASSHRPAAPQVLMADEKVKESRRTPSLSMHLMRSSAFFQKTSGSESPPAVRCFDSVRAAVDRAAIAELYVMVLIFNLSALI
mmetsp:Transcript_11790/g.25867  ORF Transcript_11790/g.25867 Transcript_11790/m.25867 type:complete len:235 (+) Transcript_11790:330-1034(+)